MNAQRPDEEARRAYWAEQMGAAYQFMETIASQPVQECGEPMVSVPEAARSASVDMLFSEAEAADGSERRFCIRQGLIEGLLAVGCEMNDRGWGTGRKISF